MGQQDQHITAHDASVKITTSGSAINLSGHGNTVDFDLGMATVAHPPGYNATVQVNKEIIKSFAGTYGGWWAGSNSGWILDSVAACLIALFGNSDTCQTMIHVAPAGSAAGSMNYSACINLTSMPVSFPSDNYATMGFSFNLRKGTLTTACTNWS